MPSFCSPRETSLRISHPFVVAFCFHTPYSVLCLFSQTSRFVRNSVSEAALVFWRFRLVCSFTVRALKCHQSFITSPSDLVNSTLCEFGVASLLVARKACGLGCQSDFVSSELASPLAAFATPAESLMAADLILAAIRSIFSESAGLRSLAISKAKVVSQSRTIIRYVTY